MQFVVETISPRTAEDYLARNTKNRNKKPVKIARYARDMASGNWRMTGEAIKFDANGNLIDGQNRLYAVIESKATIRSLVIRGLDASAQDVMDTATPRSGGDQLTIAGHRNGKDLQAAYNAHRGYHSGAVRTAGSDLTSWTRLTNAEVVSYSKLHPDLEGSLDAVIRQKRYFSGFPVGSLTVAWHEFAALDVDDAEDFFDRYVNMRFDGRGSALRALKRRTDKDAAERRNRYKLGTALFMLFRTWNAYRSGEDLQKLQIGSAEGGWAQIPDPR